jgi:hypothetical protein
MVARENLWSICKSPPPPSPFFFQGHEYVQFLHIAIKFHLKLSILNPGIFLVPLKILTLVYDIA